MSEPSRRVLLVDEDPVLRLQIDRQLDLLGWDVIAVNSGAEAIRVVELGMRPQVLLIDVRLPDIDSISVAWAATRLVRSMGVVFMGAEQPAWALEPARSPFLRKPFSTDALAGGLAAAVRYPR
jgi:two-component system, OmpR family, response regulator